MTRQLPKALEEHQFKKGEQASPSKMSKGAQVARSQKTIHSDHKMKVSQSGGATANDTP
jgi:hypothetical protein